jgi:hypothetical protein
MMNGLLFHLHFPLLRYNQTSITITANRSIEECVYSHFSFPIYQLKEDQSKHVNPYEEVKVRLYASRYGAAGRDNID